LKPIATGPLPITVSFDADYLPELPTYKPPLDLEFQLSQSLNAGLSQLEVFRQLLTPSIIDIIVAATNNYAANARTNHPDLLKPNSHARSWKPVDSTDIWRYISCLLYMGTYIERKYEEYWLENRYLTQFLNLKRFQQIHRYFTLRDKSVYLR
jgi:Transposase IS4